MNPYLTKLREKYASIETAINGIQTRAADEDRDLTEDEFRSVQGQGVELKRMAAEIEDLTEIETRNAHVGQLAASLEHTRSGGDTGHEPVAYTQDRDPGHYTRSSENSFFADLYRSATDPLNSHDAAQRLNEHQRAALAANEQYRAVTTAGGGSGILPPKYLADMYAELPRQGRPLANAVAHFDLVNPAPFTLPKQTGGTDSVVTEQAAEGDSLVDSDVFDTDVDTVSPKPTAGKQTVTRQTLDMSNPAIDAVIYSDLIGAYNGKVEKKVADAILAIGTALPASDAVSLKSAGHFANVSLDAAIAVRQGRKLPANILAMSVGRWGKFKKLRDTTGRPLIPTTRGEAVNVAGVGSVAVDGDYEGLLIVASDGILTNDEWAAIHSPSVMLWESPMLRFRYDEVQGPQKVVLGIWAYTAVKVRYGTGAVKVVEIAESQFEESSPAEPVESSS